MEASRVLDLDLSRRVRWNEIRDNLAPYPKVDGPYGEVWLDVADAPAGHVYNVPITLAPIFPAEQVGIGRGEDQLPIARRTVQMIRLEGGNDLVFQPLARARLGMLDLEWFKGPGPVLPAAERRGERPHSADRRKVQGLDELRLYDENGSLDGKPLAARGVE